MKIIKMNEGKTTETVAITDPMTPMACEYPAFTMDTEACY